MFVTCAALVENADAIAAGFMASVAGSAGQLCTKPGFLFLPTGHGLENRLAQLARQAPEHRLLNPSIAFGYKSRRDAILATSGITVIAEGSLQLDSDGQSWVTPTIVSVPVRGLQSQRESLLDEAFGPLSIVVEYADETNLAAVAADLFEGDLTGTVHTASGERNLSLSSLIAWISQHAGRVLFNGCPTGVAVTPAIQHGGPWPATTNDSSTSVSTAAIGRFLRPVADQDAPQALLPEPLRDDNPWGMPQARAVAGRSHSWGFE